MHINELANQLQLNLDIYAQLSTELSDPGSYQNFCRQMKRHIRLPKIVALCFLSYLELTAFLGWYQDYYF